MRRLFLTVVLLGFPLMSAHAQEIELYTPSIKSAPDLLFGVDASDLTEQIKQALIEETGVKSLNSFQVHWSQPSFLCLRTTNEFSPDDSNGVCLVKAGAFQVNATAHIVKKNDSLSVSILDVMIE